MVVACEHAGGYDPDRMDRCDDPGPVEPAGEPARGDSDGDVEVADLGVDAEVAEGAVAGVAHWVGPRVVSRARSEGVHATRPAGLIDRDALRDELATDTDADRGADRGADTGAGACGGLRDRVHRLQREARALLGVVSDPAVAGGELGALVDLASVVDSVQAAMVALTGRAETGMLAQRRAGLPLVEVLAITTRLTLAERRGLVRAAAGLERMPALAAAVVAGLVGAGEARTVLASCRRLTPDARATIDELFADQSRLSTQTVDAVLDEVAGRVALIDQRRTDNDRVKAFERRFLAVQPGLDGTVSGYFEIDDQYGAILLRALQDAAPPPTSDKALTRDATLPPDQTPTDRRTLGRRRADGLINLAEHWLASHPEQTDQTEQDDQTDQTDPDRPDGPQDDQTDRPGPDQSDRPEADPDRDRAAGPVGVTKPAKRARPLIYVWTDIETLVGTDATGAAARLLWDTLGPNPVLTPAAVRRLADDARLQFILTRGDEILGVAAPVTTIPAKVRAAVHARDQGCRFPGCSVPIHQTDLHHVIGRAQQGHTTVDNLVALCRRHHQAVTDARWILTMTPTGHVKVRRGRHTATSDPPTIRRL